VKSFNYFYSILGWSVEGSVKEVRGTRGSVLFG